MSPSQYQFCPWCGKPLITALKFGSHRRICADDACGFVKFNDPKVAAVAFVIQDGKVLLVKRGVEPELGKWALPAGYVDYGEDPAQAAIRETREETGLEINITRLYDVMFYADTNKVIVIIYQGEPIGGQLSANDDAVAVGWFAPDALPDVAFESSQVVLRQWVASLAP